MEKLKIGRQGNSVSFWVTVTGKSGFRALAIQAKSKPTFLQSQFEG